MCARNQAVYSRLRHMLLSVYGSAWSKRRLGMFTIYIDDSGTAPEQKMAVAAGIVVPAARISKFESEWTRFLREEHIPEFHASECLARNQHSPFASWDEETVRRVFSRVRQLTIRFSVKGYCIGIHKHDYDEVLTPDLKAAVGNSHYAWALSSVLGHALDFAEQHKAPMAYVFDNAEKVVKREITDALEFAENIYPGKFAGNWTFGKRADIPALQGVDLFAWTCFQQFRRARFNTPIPSIANETDAGYALGRNGQWRTIQSLTREGIEKWAEKNRNNPRTSEIIKFKKERAHSRKTGAR